MQTTTTLIIGAGQCGLAMSHDLTRRSIDHIVLEAGQAGESWRSRRWPSLRLLTPNWMNLLPGQRTAGDDPDGYMSAASFADEISAWADHVAPPLQTHTTVLSLERSQGGFLTDTDRGPIRSRSVVIATGACAIPRIPSRLRPAFPRVWFSGRPSTTAGPKAFPRGAHLSSAPPPRACRSRASLCCRAGT